MRRARAEPAFHQIEKLALRTPWAPFRRFRRAAAPIGRPDLVRLGTDYGGWTIPHDLVLPSWICYSGGIGNDISFDLELIRRYGCVVYAFDPTPSAIRYVESAASGNDRFRLFPCGLWSEDETVAFHEHEYADTNFSAVNLHNTEGYFEAPCRSLPSIMTELGHDRIDLLKLDIEGAEYRVLQPVIAREIEPTVLCVEFHKTNGITAAVQAVRRLRDSDYGAVSVRGYDVTFVGPSGALGASTVRP